MNDASDERAFDQSGRAESLSRLIETMVTVELSGVTPAEDSALDWDYLAEVQERVVPVLSGQPANVDAEALLIDALNLWAERP